MAQKMTWDEAEALADETLNDAYGTVTIMGYEFDQWDAYKELDPLAARLVLLDYVDAQIADGEWVVEDD